MRRGLIALFAAIVLVLVASVGLAAAKNGRSGAGSRHASLYESTSTCADGADRTSGSTFGSVLVNPVGKPGAPKAVLVVFKLRAAEEETTYDVFVRQHRGDCDSAKVGTVTTNKHGNATMQVKVAKVSGATKAWAMADPVPSGRPTLSTRVVALD